MVKRMFFAISICVLLSINLGFVFFYPYIKASIFTSLLLVIVAGIDVAVVFRQVKKMV